MFKRKLFLFGFVSALVLVVALVVAAISAHLTRQNLEHSSKAQMLLTEYQALSGISYRLFKQLTDELIFGQNANQAEVRNKQNLIAASLQKIRELEQQQKSALRDVTYTSNVEDTDRIEKLIEEITQEFNDIVSSNDSTPLNQQARVQRLLEITIDNQFREAVNAAVMHQGSVVAANNARIDTLNSAIMWFTLGLGVIILPVIVLGCYWLFNQLYQPLSILKSGTQAIASGDYSARIPGNLDAEFKDLALTLNQLVSRLSEHEKMNKSLDDVWNLKCNNAPLN